MFQLFPNLTCGLCPHMEICQGLHSCGTVQLQPAVASQKLGVGITITMQHFAVILMAHYAVYRHLI